MASMKRFLILGLALLSWTAPLSAVIPTAELLGRDAGQLIQNQHYLPSDKAQAPRQPFSGGLRLLGAEMAMEPAPAKAKILGRDVRLFPDVTLDWISDGEDLVPLERDVILAGSLTQSGSFWDIVVAPGRVWSEPGEEPWSRASFAFSLVNTLENETHHGLATFLYDEKRVSGVRYQIVRQTAPYLVEKPFSAWGRLEAAYERKAFANGNEVVAAFRREVAARLPVRPLRDLEKKIGQELLAAVEGSPDEVITSGFLVDGTLYLQPCHSPQGEMPDCSTTPFGIWSVTKTFGNAVALLRLAEKYGPEVFDQPLAPLLPVPSELPELQREEWQRVTLKDALNMATGMGEGSTRTEPNDPTDGYLVGYAPWYEASSAAHKVREILKASAHPWGPGKVMRYRDQDHFLLGAALNGLVQKKEKRGVLEMLAEEVYGPIGIHHVPWCRTLEEGEAPATPLMSQGALTSVDDLAKVARLLSNSGRHGERQILHADKVAEALYRTPQRGLIFGQPRPEGDHASYHMAFWHEPFHAGAEGDAEAGAEGDAEAGETKAEGCIVDLPQMKGWGGHVIALFPNGIIGLRIASGDPNESRGDGVRAMAAAADKIRPFCDPG